MISAKKTGEISPLPLSDHQILDIVTQHLDLGVLNISHNKQVTIDVVEKLLVALLELQRLLVLFRNLEGFFTQRFSRIQISSRAHIFIF